MLIRQLCGHPSSGGSLDEAFLYEERFVDLLQSSGVFTYGRSDRSYSDGATTEFRDDRMEDIVVDLVESPLVYVESIEGIA